MAEKTRHNYDESKIKTLSSLEHLALRFVMVTVAIFALVAQDGSGQTPSALRMGESEFRKFLEDKIKTESGGLGSFDFLDTRQLGFGKNSVAFHFLAGVKFSEPCVWDIRSKNGRLSFRAVSLKNVQQTTKTKDQQVLETTRKGQGWHLTGDVVFEFKDRGWSVVDIKVPIYPKQSELYDFAYVRCDENMRQIFSEFRKWAYAHNKAFSFCLSTNIGGTKEFCVADHDGSDLQAMIHSRAMIDLKFNPYFLVCPADSLPKAASIVSLQATNISYKLRTGPSVRFSGGKEVLLWCPIHRVAVCCNGSTAPAPPAQ